MTWLYLVVCIEVSEILQQASRPQIARGLTFLLGETEVGSSRALCGRRLCQGSQLVAKSLPLNHTDSASWYVYDGSEGNLTCQ